VLSRKNCSAVFMPSPLPPRRLQPMRRCTRRNTFLPVLRSMAGAALDGGATLSPLEKPHAQHGAHGGVGARNLDAAHRHGHVLLLEREAHERGHGGRARARD